jgi:uncharacterized protein GlcG (DUF336 family)
MVTLKDAKNVIAAAEKKATELEQPMNIAVADAGGNLIAHVRMDDAWMGSIDIAIKKAFTARAFDITTNDLAALSQSGGQFFGIHASRGSGDDLQAACHQTRRQGGGRHRRQRWFGRAGSRRGGKRALPLSIESQ